MAHLKSLLLYHHLYHLGKIGDFDVLSDASIYTIHLTLGKALISFKPKIHNHII